jgi:hypothetical protein
MRAVLMTAVGGPEVLKVEEVPDPQVTGEHDVLVRLRAAGLNPVDYKLRSHGTFGNTLPAILGWDGAGVVERTGRAVSRVRPGDEVYFCDGGFGPTPGTYAELKVVDERYLARKPERLSFVAAAAAPLVTITAWEALRERARLSAGQTVLLADPSVRGPGLERRESVGSRSDHCPAQPEPAGLLRLDAGPVGLRLARAPGAPASDPGAGGRAHRRRRAPRAGRRDVSPGAGG